MLGDIAFAKLDITLQSANEYGVVEEKPKCTGKRTRPGTPSSPDLGGSVRLFDEDGNQLETDRKTGEIKGTKGTVLQFYSFANKNLNHRILHDMYCINDIHNKPHTG